jgi:translation initiation factor IF-2
VRGTAPSLAPPPAPGFETPQGPKVLGRIDLRKTVPPPGATAWRPPGPGGAAAPAPGTTPGAADAPKRKSKKVIQKDDIAVMQERDFGGRGKRPMKKRVQPGKEVRKTEVTTPRASKRIIRISEVISVADLARAIGVKASEVMKKLIDMGVMATINQMLDHDTAVLVAGEFEYQVENVAFDVEQTLEQEQAEGTPAKRFPVRRSSRSWATSTTARRRCSTRSAPPKSRPARPAASRSTSAPTRSTSTAAWSRSSTRRATRRSPPCARAARR